MSTIGIIEILTAIQDTGDMDLEMVTIKNTEERLIQPIEVKVGNNRIKT
jgi:hypothetical protein